MMTIRDCHIRWQMDANGSVFKVGFEKYIMHKFSSVFIIKS